MVSVIYTTFLRYNVNNFSFSICNLATTTTKGSVVAGIINASNPYKNIVEMVTSSVKW